MSSFASKHEQDEQFSVHLNIEADEVRAIGKEMEAINEEAYMNGYN